MNLYNVFYMLKGEECCGQVYAMNIREATALAHLEYHNIHSISLA